MKRQGIFIIMFLLLFNLFGCGDTNRPAASGVNDNIKVYHFKPF